VKDRTIHLTGHGGEARMFIILGAIAVVISGILFSCDIAKKL
jgi:hypothetical protein